MIMYRVPCMIMSCVTYYAPCVHSMYHVPCIMYHVSCIMYHIYESRIMHHVRTICIMRSARVPCVSLLSLSPLAVSPVLATLTSSYSSDTIWFLTLVLHLIHFLSFDYSYINTAHLSTSPPFWGIISFNAGICTSILLASRLTEAIQVFAFMLAAFQIYAGYPVLARCIKVKEHMRSMSIGVRVLVLYVML